MHPRLLRFATNVPAHHCSDIATKVMALSLSQRSARIEQTEIRAMSIECKKVGGINLAQGVCDTCAFLSP